MKNIASFFTPEMQHALKERLGVALSDQREYTADELEALFERITDEFPLSYEEDSGKPVGVTAVMEDMIDVFIKNKLIEFN